MSHRHRHHTSTPTTIPTPTPEASSSQPESIKITIGDQNKVTSHEVTIDIINMETHTP